MNNKEKFHFEILKRKALDSCCASDYIALNFDLDKAEIDTLYDIFDNFEQKDFHYSELEAHLKRELNLNYQDLKSIIHYFYEDYKYVDVISSYLRSNKETNGNLSIEYINIAKELGI